MTFLYKNGFISPKATFILLAFYVNVKYLYKLNISDKNCDWIEIVASLPLLAKLVFEEHF